MKVRKWLSLLLSLILTANLLGGTMARAEMEQALLPADDAFEFESLDDPAFLQYLEDSVYASLEADYADSESTFQIEDVNVKFVSREYLEETAYNSKANIFFGYTLAQIDEVFQGKKYVFTLSDTGETVVQEFQEIPNDTYNKIIKNVLIGTDVILVAVTVSVATAGAATPAVLASTGTATAAAKVHMIFAASASKAISFATSGTLFAGATSLVTRGFETNWDTGAMAESGLLSASEGFKWGAITGAIVGGSNKALEIHSAGTGIVTPRQAEIAAHEAYGGKEQVAYLNGIEVPRGTPGAVVPDIVVGSEAIEVKRYDLMNRLDLLKTTLLKQVSKRVQNLPKGMTQRIVLNVEGHGYTLEFVQKVINELKEVLTPVYPNIPIDVMGAMI